MRKNRTSETASMVAAVRAWHRRFHDSPKIFDDPFADKLIPNVVWRLACASRAIGKLSIKLPYASFETVFAQILMRARWAEERLERAVAAGIAQYVVLGAGLDSFALRRHDLAHALKVFEVDHPATQSAKRRRMEKLKLDAPRNLEFAPVDFENEGLKDGLSRSSFSTERPAFFSWMGATFYLSREAVFQTLGTIASIAPRGSELVFDYLVPEEQWAKDERSKAHLIRRLVENSGEPWLSSFDPASLSSELSSLGFDTIEHLSPAEQEARYLAGRRDLKRASSASYFVHCRLRK